MRGDDLKLHMEVGVQEHLDHILSRPVLQDHPIHREETVTDVQCTTPGRRERGGEEESEGGEEGEGGGRRERGRGGGGVIPGTHTH